MSDNASFGSFADGALTVVVRKETWRPKVREALGRVDLPTCFPGFRRLEVEVAGDVGQTGRERRDEAESAARRAASEAAARSPTVKRLIAAFSAHLEAVEPVVIDLAAPAEEAGVED